MKKLIIMAVAAVAALASCKSQYDMLLSSNNVDEKFDAAMAFFNEGKYQKAAALFESMSVYVGGTPKEDTVQYYWGLSNYRFKDFYTAEGNFAKFAESFPMSPFTEDARFLRLDCLYRQTLRYELDQSPTYACISAISEFMADYPDTYHKEDCLGMLKMLGDRLDRKAYEAAKLYYHMEDYKAARVAFRNVLKDDAENIYREDILYYIAMSSYKFAHLSIPEKQKERYLTFMDDYLNFIGEIPESPYRRELDAMYSRAQRALGRYTGSDELLDRDDKDFAREREEAAKAN